MKTLGIDHNLRCVRSDTVTNENQGNRFPTKQKTSLSWSNHASKSDVWNFNQICEIRCRSHREFSFKVPDNKSVALEACRLFVSHFRTDSPPMKKTEEFLPRASTFTGLPRSHLSKLSMMFALKAAWIDAGPTVAIEIYPQKSWRRHRRVVIRARKILIERACSLEVGKNVMLLVSASHASCLFAFFSSCELSPAVIPCVCFRYSDSSFSAVSVHSSLFFKTRFFISSF